MTDLCFQMYAEVKDVDELLEMIRTTCLTDYIRLEGFAPQPLQLINPGGVFLKYLMPKGIPTTLKVSQPIALNKGYYKGVFFDIPGAEVKLNGTWTPVTEANKAAIKAQNPFTLEWRLNGSHLHNYGYKPGDTLKGQIIAVDDAFNGLSLTKDFTVILTE